MTESLSTLSGLVCIRQGFALDYPWEQCVQSLLPVCDEVVICDCDSSDGTRERINRWVSESPKINPVNFPWTDPRGDIYWYPKWINYTREHATSKHVIHLDADEVIHEDDYPLIRQAAKCGDVLYCKRLNFWRDPKHLIPEGVCCGTKVLRIAPKDMPIPSDYPYEPANATQERAKESEIRIFHYGFLRHREAFFKKAREVQRIWCNSYDPRLEKAEQYEGHWAEMPGVTGWEDKLVNYDGSHPAAIKEWLAERSHAH